MIEKYIELGKHYQDIYSKKYRANPKVEIKKKLTFREFVNEVYTSEKGFHDLYPFQYEMAEWFLNQVGLSLVLATRGIGKTLILTALTSLYRIYENPKSSILIISYKYTSSEAIIRYIAQIINANKEFFNDLIDFKELKAQSIRTNSFKGKGANITIASLNSTIRGIHTDIIIFDDLVTDDSSISFAYREKTKRYYEEAQKVAKSIQFVGNITHPLDLHSELRLKDNIPKFEIYANDDRIPDIFKPDIEKERLQGISEASIQKNYFGILLPDENLPFYDVRVINQGDIEFNPEGFKGATPYVFYDFSQGKKDLSCFSMCWQVGYKLYVYGYAVNEDWDMFIKRTSEYIKGFKNIYFESNTSGEYMGARAFKQQGVEATGRFSSGHKETKIQAIYPLRNNILLVNDGTVENNRYIEQFQGYTPSNSNSGDDAVDSLAMCLIEMGIINTK